MHKKQKSKQTAKPLADPDARGPDIPDHVKRPNPDPFNPVSLTVSMSSLRDPLIFCFRIDAQLIEHTYRSQFLTMLASVDVGV